MVKKGQNLKFNGNSQRLFESRNDFKAVKVYDNETDALKSVRKLQKSLH